jgi:hypothetical protein
MDPDTLKIIKATTSSGAKELVAQIFNLIRSPITQNAIIKRQISNSEANLKRMEIDYGLSREQAQELNRDMVVWRELNYLDIVKKALPEIIDTSSLKNVSKDWIVFHHDKASICSDDNLQNIWAKILAGEINSPGRFSRYTLNVLDLIEPENAKDFSMLGSFCFDIEGEKDIAFFQSSRNYDVQSLLPYSRLLDLELFGLIEISKGFSAGRICHFNSEIVNINYFDKHFQIRTRNDEQKLVDLGLVRLTKVGRELLPICGAEPNEDILEMTIQQWKEHNSPIVEDINKP